MSSRTYADIVREAAGEIDAYSGVSEAHGYEVPERRDISRHLRSLAELLDKASLHRCFENDSPTVDALTSPLSDS